MRIIYCVLFCLASIQSIAQPTLEFTDPSFGGSYASVNYLDPSAVGQKKVENISYDDIRGSAFWDDKWNAAVFVLRSNKAAKVKKARLNLYANEIQFLDVSGTELALENTQVQKVIFFKGTDTTSVLAIFESLPDSLSQTKLSYYQVLNSGKFRLLILKKNFVSEGEYNPTLGTRDHSFYSKTSYAIANDQNILFVKSFDQTGIFEAIHASPEEKQWVFQNKYKLKNEIQVVSFFNYCNSQVK